MYYKRSVAKYGRERVAADKFDRSGQGGWLNKNQHATFSYPTSSFSQISLCSLGSIGG